MNRLDSEAIQSKVQSIFAKQRGLNGLVHYRGSSRLPPEKPRNALSPEYDHLGAYLLLRRQDSTAVSLYRTPQWALIFRSSSNSYFDQAPDSPPPYGRS